MTASGEVPAAAYRARRLGVRHVERACLCVLLLAAFMAAAWFDRESLLRGAAELWTVSGDAVGPADAVAILGGRPEVRAVAAAAYYRNGLSTKVLVSNTRPGTLEALGIERSHAALNRVVLLKLGVPEAAIETYGSGVSSTYDEAVALREWAIHTRARNIIVPTEQFSSRRVRWVLNHVLANSGIKVQVPALDDPDYRNGEWWKSEKGLLVFQNEVIKHIYYRFKY